MRRSVAPGRHQGADLRDRLVAVQALVREVTALGQEAEALVCELEAERAKDTPLCSINEAARRLGKTTTGFARSWTTTQGLNRWCSSQTCQEMRS
jgi:hypothetical protein